jgi:hypothetical protein
MALYDLAQRRAKYGYNGPAVIFLGRCFGHVGRGYQVLGEANCIVSGSSPLRSSNQLHAPDLSLLGNAERDIARANKLNTVIST